MAKLRKLLSVILAVVMVTSLCGISALADGECTCTTKCVDGSVNSECPVCGADGADLTLCKGTDDATPTYVAQIEDTKYETLDAAVTAAADGDTIEVLCDCTTEMGLNLSKNLTIQAATDVETKPTITFTTYGIALWGKALTFKDVDVSMIGIHSTPYTAEWNWMTICANKNASLSLDNVKMTMDDWNDETPHVGKNGTTYGQHAIYFCSNNKLNLTNGTVLTIKNYQQDALEWDGGDGGYNVNITDSTFISDHNRSGFTGTFYATITNSNVDVINSLGNGSNGSHFIITDDSHVNFNDNGSHGLSTGTLTIDNSTVNANRNGANGIHAAGTLTITNESDVTVEGNGCSICSQWTIPGALYVGVDGTIEESTVTIRNNSGSGIYQKSAAKTLEIKNSATVTIINNTAVKLGYGGGIYANGTVKLADNVVLYNNHAGTAGDDIYSVGTITFGKTGSGWILDDCNHTITGWFYDGYEPQGEDGEALTTRWNVITAMGNSCEDDREDAYYVEYTVPAEAVTGVLALKAAHGYIDDTPYVPTPSNYTLTVKYVDENGNEIAASDVSTLTAGISYSTSAKEIEGYTFKEWDSTSDAVSGYMTGSKTVVYIYTASETEIPDEETPLDPSAPVDPDETDIPDENPPLDDSPKTGDERLPLAALWSLFVLSAMGLFTLAVTGRKTGKHETDR